MVIGKLMEMEFNNTIKSKTTFLKPTFLKPNHPRYNSICNEGDFIVRGILLPLIYIQKIFF